LTPRRLTLLLLACLTVAAAILAGCGGGSSKNVDVGPAAAVPQNAAIYLDATVKPTGVAKTNADAALGKILRTSDPGAKIVSLIDKQRTSTGQPVDYATDVAPWLGQKAGLFFTKLGIPAQGAAVIETTNPSSALAFAKKANGTSGSPKTVDGVTYYLSEFGRTAYGVDGNFLLVGNEAGVQDAIKAKAGDSLGDQSDFKDAIGDLPSDRLGTLYTIPKTLISSLGPAQISPSSQAFLQQSAGESLTKPVAGAISATSDAIQLDATGGSNGVETPQSSLLATVPSDSWLAVGIGHLGDVIKQNLTQLKTSIPNFESVASQIQATTGASVDQLAAALGDAVIYVGGVTQPTLTGALVVQTKDPGLTGRLLGQLQSLLQLGAGSSGASVKPLHLSGGGTGFQMSGRSIAPQPIELAQQGDKIVIGYGAGSAEKSLAPAQPISGSQPFSTASGQVSSLGTDFFLDFPKVFSLVKSSGSGKNPQFLQAKPYLNALSYLVTGSGTENGKTEVKAVFGLK
jgi:uncharacterized protein DUF3352